MLLPGQLSDRMLNGLHRIHHRTAHQRRTEKLAIALAAALPADPCDVLDVGSGDGLLASRIRQIRPDVEITGLDIVARREAYIPVALYDGETLPLDDDTVDVVVLCDVVHHAADGVALLTEAARVARRSVIIKDHVADSAFDRQLLRLMDWVGNRHNEVPLPYAYWDLPTWRRNWAAARLEPTSIRHDLAIYPAVLDRVIGGDLHLLAVCRPSGGSVSAP